MNTKRLFALLLSVMLLLGLTGCQDDPPPVFSRPTLEGFDSTIVGDVTIDILSIGKADAILITTKNHAVVIDTGEDDDGGKVLDALAARGVDTIDYLIITHFDRDHVGGAERVISLMPVKQILQPNYSNDRKEFTKYQEAVKAHNVPVTVMGKEDIDFYLDDVQFNVTPPWRNKYPGNEYDNQMSLVVTMWHGNNTFVFAGDAQKERLKELIARGGLKADFLKVPHHGVMDSSSEQFLQMVQPEYAVICDSNKNPASDELLSLLNVMGVKVYQTKDGDVTCVSDGQTLTVTQTP